MTYSDKLIRDLAKQYKLDFRIIRSIVLSQYKFVKSIIKDPYDLRPIRLHYFGVFDIKHSKLKVKMNNIKAVLFDNIKDVMVMMATTLGFQITGVASAKRIIEEAVETKDIEKMKMIWAGWLEYNK